MGHPSSITTRGRGRYALHPRGSSAPVLPLGGGPVTRGRVGQARIQGRFRQPEAPFALARGVRSDGGVSVQRAVDAVIADWWRQVADGRVAGETVTTFEKVAVTFLAYMLAMGATRLRRVTSELLWAWVNSPATGTRAAERPTESMRALRRAVAVALYNGFYVLGFTEANLGSGLPSIPRPPRMVSAFSDDAIARLKEMADFEASGGDRESGPTYTAGSTVTPSCLALTVLGAQTGEVGAVRVRDIDLLAMTVFLHDGGTRYDARTVPIDDPWAFDALAARLAHLSRTGAPDPDRLVAYTPARGKEPTFTGRSAATAATLGRLIRVAGLREPGRIRVASVNEWLAARIFAETGRVEAVAARLGMRSLDAAAHLVGYDWRADFAIQDVAA